MVAPFDCRVPCIVLGLETQIGLAIVRELGRAGVRVIGIAHDQSAIGLASRFLEDKIVVPQPRSPELIIALRKLGESYGTCSLIAVSEANLTWLAANRNLLDKVNPITPTHETLAVVLDKQRTLAAAKAVAINVPESIEPVSMKHASELAISFKFPAVLKWKDPNAVVKKLENHGVDMIKAEYVYSPEQFMAVARRYEPLGEWPILQTYCPGRGLGQFFYMHQGKAVRRFQHLRVAEWPPEGGFSSVCDSIPLDEHSALQDKSIALLKHIGWDGVAMVEYRWDPTTNDAVLMEINGRYWGSYPLAVHCGGAFAPISYFLANGIALPPLPSVSSGIRCRMMSTELKRLYRILFDSKKIVDRSFKVEKWAELSRFVADFFRPRVRYYVWDKDDPGPFRADMANLICKALGRLLGVQRQ